MNNRPLQSLEIQLLLAILFFVIISWPVITGQTYSPADTFYRLFSTWLMIPAAQLLLIGRQQD